jgi:hypothetical protein
MSPAPRADVAPPERSTGIVVGEPGQSIDHANIGAFEAKAQLVRRLRAVEQGQQFTNAKSWLQSSQFHSLGTRRLRDNLNRFLWVE